MVVVSILYFFVTTIFLSFILDLFTDYRAGWFEQFFMRIGIGLAFLSVLGVILDLLFIPINAWIILGISTVFPVIHTWKNREHIEEWLEGIGTLKISFKKLIFYSLLLAMFGVTTYMYMSGSFGYPYMEDGDPWGYTAVSKVIAEEETFKADYRYNHYSEPYTQGYQIVMGILHQTNNSMYWTMKFFHNLILGLSIPFFYFFAKNVLPESNRREEYAFFSTVALFAIPSWVTHFIFSFNYNMVLFLVLLYALTKVNTKGWSVVTGLLLASIFVNHAFTAILTTMVLGLYIFFTYMHSGEIPERLVDAGYLGFLVSLLFYVPSSLRHSYYFTEFVNESHGGLEKVLFPLFNNITLLLSTIILIIGFYTLVKTKKYWSPKVREVVTSKNTRLSVLGVFYGVLFVLTFVPRKLVDIEGTASRSYSFMDFWEAAPRMINNTVGFGPVIFILTSLALLYFFSNINLFFEKEKRYLFTSFNIFFVLLWLVFGYDHSVLFMTFRVWTYLAIFTSLLAGFGLYIIYNTLESTDLGELGSYAVVSVLIVLMIFTSFMPKYEHNTNVWPEHRIQVPESYAAYNFIREELPKDSNVIRTCGNTYILAAYDAYPPLTEPRMSPQWRDGPENTPSIYEEIYSLSTDELYTELTDKDVEYLVSGVSCVAGNNEDQEELQELIRTLEQDERFTPIFSTSTEVVVEIR